MLSYPPSSFTQDGNNFPYFYEDLIEIPDRNSDHTSDRGTFDEYRSETDAYASGSGIVIGGEIREHLRLIPLAEGRAK